MSRVLEIEDPGSRSPAIAAHWKTFPELDGVRSLAILPVLAFHATFGQIRGGFLGVDLFFVLSGFLITSLLSREYARSQHINFLHFFARRALRIVPALLLGLLLATALGQFDILHAATPILLFFANYVSPASLGSMTHTWSLSVEEQFYLVWPFVFAAALRAGGRRGALAAALVFFCASLALRTGLTLAGFDVEVLYRSTLVRADSLAAGCIAALAAPTASFNRSKTGSNVIALLLLGAYTALVFMADKHNRVMATIGYATFAGVAAVAIRGLIGSPAAGIGRRLCSHPAMTYVGKRSYGIYVYHYPIFGALESLHQQGGIWSFGIVSILRIACTFAVADLSFRLVERPVLSLKRKFRYDLNNQHGHKPCP